MHHPDIDWLTARPIAHRGYHDVSNGIVENSRQSAERAMTHGFSIEMDLQVTKDGKAAVFHDLTLDRLTKAAGPLDAYDMAELATLSFRWSDDTIMELPDLLQLVAGKVPLVVELKNPRDQDGRLERAVASAIEGYDGHIAVMSFSPVMIENLIPLTDRPRGIVACDFFSQQEGQTLADDVKYSLTHLLHAPQSKPDFVSYHHKDFPMPGPDLLRALFGMPVICWTTKDADSHANALKYCDQVTFEGYNPDELPLTLGKHIDFAKALNVRRARDPIASCTVHGRNRRGRLERLS